MADKFDYLFLTPEEEQMHSLIRLEKSFIRNPEKMLYDMEVEFYEQLEDLKRKKAQIISYRNYVKKLNKVE